MHFEMDHLVSVMHVCTVAWSTVCGSAYFPCVSFSDPNESLVIVLRELDGLSDWKSLGLQLGLNYSTLSEIQANEPDTSHCKMAMLHLWLSLRDGVKDRGGATKATLVRALYSIKENALAHRIETKGFNSAHSPAPTCEFYTTCVRVTPYQMQYSSSRL